MFERRLVEQLDRGGDPDLGAARAGRGLRRGARADALDSRKMISACSACRPASEVAQTMSAFHLVQHQLHVAELVGEQRIRRPDCRCNGRRVT